MIKCLTPFYKSVLSSESPAIIVMKGSGEKAFCAGGDVKNLWVMKQDGKSVDDITNFFEIEYELNKIIGTLPNHVCQVSLLNGITMGGGVGLSVHGNYRVAMENTMFAMPETALGFFCDVGGSYFLPRLPHAGLGMWLALTGARLKGADIFHSGIATHFVNVENLASLEQNLLSLSHPNEVSLTLQEYLDNATVSGFTPPVDEIERCFSPSIHTNVESILEALNGSEWGQKQAGLMDKMSPSALKIVYQQLVNGARLNFINCFEMEIDMAREFMAGTEFFEGVRSVLVDRDRNPQWNPTALDGVSDESVRTYYPRVDSLIASQN